MKEGEAVASRSNAALQHELKYIGQAPQCKDFLLQCSNLGGNF
jgi:hypothetical protein